MRFMPEAPGSADISRIWMARKAEAGALVGWIDEHKPEILGYESYERQIIQRIILISRGGLFKSYGNGNLFLAMGEFSGCKECDGKMEVLITVYD